MAQSFRSAFNGFNRNDVVQYLEYINNKHTAQVNQLTSELEFVKQKLSEAEPAADSSDRVAELEAQLEALTEENEALKLRCEELEQRQPAASDCGPEQELEAYRRAERAERVARERADLIYRQTNSVVADASAKIENAAADLDAVSRQISGQISQLQGALDRSKLALQDVAATMYRLHPANNEE